MEDLHDTSDKTVKEAIDECVAKLKSDNGREALYALIKLFTSSEE